MAAGAGLSDRAHRERVSAGQPRSAPVQCHRHTTCYTLPPPVTRPWKGLPRVSQAEMKTLTSTTNTSLLFHNFSLLVLNNYVVYNVSQMLLFYIILTGLRRIKIANWSSSP